MAQIDSLSIKINASVSQAKNAIEQLVGTVDRLNKSLSSLDTSKFDTLSTACNNLTQSMAGFNSVNSQNIKDLASGLKRLNNIDFSNAATINAGVTTLSQGLTTLNGITVNGDSIISIAKALRTFDGLRFKEAAPNIKDLGLALQQFTPYINQIQIDPKNAENLAAFGKAIGSLGTVTSGRALQNIPQLSVAMQQLMNSLANVRPVSENTIRLAEALGRIASSGEQAGHAARTISRAMNFYNNNTHRAARNTSGFASAVGMLYARFWALMRIIRMVGRSIQASMDYIETFNFYDVTMNKVGAQFADKYADYGYDSAEAYVKSFNERMTALTSKLSGFTLGEDGLLERTGEVSLGLNPERVMDYEATVMSLTNAIGMTGEASVTASKALTMLSSDMSSLKNVDLDQAMGNFSSALVGQTRAVDKYGISIRTADLQQTLYDLGIQENVAHLTQDVKAQLRLITMLKQSKVAWGDLARTLNSPANQMRQLTSNGQMLSQMFGQLLLPTVAKILPYINAIVVGLQRLLTWIAQVAKIDLSGIISSSGASDSIGDLLDDTDDLAGGLDKATGSAKKLKAQLQGFDEINNLTSDKGGGGASGGASALDLTSALNDAFAEYEKVWNDAYSKAENFATNIADRLQIAFTNLAQTAKPATEALKTLFNDGFKQFGQFSFGAIESLWQDYLKPIGEWTLSDDNGVKRLFGAVNDLLTGIEWNRILGHLSAFFEALQKPTKLVFTALSSFVEKVLVPIGKWVFNKALTVLFDTISSLVNKINWTKLSTVLEKLFTDLGHITSVNLDKFSDLLQGVLIVLTDIASISLNGIIDAIDMLLDHDRVFSITPKINFDDVKLQSGGIANVLKQALGSFDLSIYDILPWDMKDFVDDLNGYFTSVGVEISKTNKAAGDYAEKIALSNYQTGLYGTSVETLLGNLSGYNEYLGYINGNIDKLNGLTPDNAGYVKNLAERYEELASKSSLTNDEQRLLAYYSGELVKAMPELNGYVNEETGLLEAQVGVIDRLIEKRELQYKLEAAQDMLKDIYREQLQVQLDLEEAQDNYNASLSDFNKTEKTYLDNKEKLIKAAQRYNPEIKSEHQAIRELQKRGGYETLIKNVRDSRDAFDKAKKTTQGYKSVMEDLTNKNIDLTKSQDKVNGIIEDTVKAIDKVDFGSMANRAATAITDTHNALANGKSVFTTDAQNLTNSVSNEFGKLPGKASEAGAKTVSGFSNAIINNRGSLTQTLDNTLGNTMNDVKDKIVGIGANAGSGFVDALSQGIANAKGNISSKASTLANTISDLLGSSTKLKIDVDTESAFNKIDKFIANVNKAIQDGVKTQLNIGVNVAGKVVMGATKGYATGGFPTPEDGWFRASQTEMLGKFDNGKSVVANNQQIIAGINQGVQSGMQTALAEQNYLLRQQNEYLGIIAQKDTTISSSDIFSAVQAENRTYYKQTGRNAFAFN